MLDTLEYDLGEKKIDLSELSNYITGFFQRKDFSVSIFNIKNGCKISAKPKAYSDIKGKIIVEIKGKPHSFSVTFNVDSFLGRFTVLGNFLTLIFGGYPILRELKSRENLERVEKEFWVYINDVIEKLVGDSAS